MNTSDQNTIPPDIYQFLNLLIEDSKIQVKNEAVRDIMIEELYGSLNTYLGSVFMQHLLPDKLTELKQLQETQMDKETVERFIVSNISDAKNVVTQAFLDFRELFLSQSLAQAN